MAAIVAATMLGLAYLTQTLGSNATTSEIRDLAGKQVSLQVDLDRQRVEVERRVDADALRSIARTAKLNRLGDVVVLTAP